MFDISTFNFQLVIVMYKAQVELHAIIVVYAVVMLTSLVTNALHVKLDIIAFLLVEVSKKFNKS